MILNHEQIHFLVSNIRYLQYNVDIAETIGDYSFHYNENVYHVGH